MKTQPIIPTNDEKAELWLINFAYRLPAVATTFGISTAEVNQTAEDSSAFIYCLLSVKNAVVEKEERISFKDLVRKGSTDTGRIVYPSLPTPPPPPMVDALPGAFNRAAAIAQRIKAHPKYTDSVGRDLGIVAPESTFDPDTYKPTIKVVNVSKTRKITFSKSSTDGVNIYFRLAEAGRDWTFLARDTSSPYIDSTVYSTPTELEYMAKGVIKDAELPTESDPAIIITK